MATEQDAIREKAYEIWRKCGGRITNKDIAAALDVDSSAISEWKRADAWKAKGKLERKRGGQPGNRNAIGNKGGPPKGSQNNYKHGFYSKYIPIEDIELVQSMPGVGKLEGELQLARYRLLRLVRAQESKGLKGTGFGPVGAETYSLQDDFYENLIQKAIRMIADLEFKISKIKQEGIGMDHDDVVIIDDVKDVEFDESELENENEEVEFDDSEFSD